MKAFLFFLVLALLQSILARSSAAEKLVVGYREDAQPFVYLTKPSASTFGGFIAELCDRALDLSGYEVERIPVNARSRWTALKTKKIDMLCDTTSVTIKRASERLFSPIIFLSGVSYAYSPRAEQAFFKAYSKEKKPVYSPGLDKAAKPAAAAPYCANQPQELQPQLPPDRIPLLRVGVLSSTTADIAVRKKDTLKLFRLRPGEQICIDSLNANYADGIDKLCSGEFAYFFGDRDMLQAYLTEKLKRQPECDAILSGKFFSYEPYALIVRMDRTDLALKLQSALFQLFSSGEAEKLFDKYFKDRPKSDLLRALFRINAVGRMR